MQRRAITVVTGLLAKSRLASWALFFGVNLAVAGAQGWPSDAFGRTSDEPPAAEEGQGAQQTSTPSGRVAADRAVLEDAGVAPTSEGAIQYIQSLQPGENQLAQVKKLIADLGHEDFRRREEATQELVRTGNGVHPLLISAARDNADPEIRWRAQSVVRLSETKSAATLLSAFRLLAAEPVKGTAPAILASLPLCRRPYIADAAHAALQAAVDAGDADLLRKAISDGPSPTRIGAAKAFAGAFPSTATPELATYADDGDERFAAAIARILANNGDRRCLPALVRLLASEDLEVRAEASLVLRMATGEHFGFAAYDPKEKRSAAADRWRKWLAEKGDSVALKAPLAPPRLARGELQGNTLISTGSLGRIEERDPTGKVVWSYPVAAWSAEKLINGNVLIGSYNTNQILEVDSSGGVVWQMGGINAMRAKPLPDGRILVADFSGERVLEIDREKRIVWQQPTAGQCFDCDRLSNGNTLFGCPNRVCEITPEGVVVREWKVGGRLNGFQLLENGNLLVANYGENRVVELDPEGAVVWEHKEPQPCDAFRTVDGYTLISTSERIIELAPDGRVIGQISQAKYGSARR